MYVDANLLFPPVLDLGCLHLSPRMLEFLTIEHRIREVLRRHASGCFPGSDYGHQARFNIALRQRTVLFSIAHYDLDVTGPEMTIWAVTVPPMGKTFVFEKGEIEWLDKELAESSPMPYGTSPSSV